MNQPNVSANRRPRVVLIGDAASAEIASCVDWLAARTDVFRFDAVEAATIWLADTTRHPAVIVLIQSRPGRFSNRQVDRLRLAAPLSPIVSLLGSWCEGEMRTGAPWPGVMRVYWHQWVPRVARELERMAGHGCPIWSLPPTVSENDRWMVRGSEMSTIRHGDMPSHRGLVAIRTDHAVAARGLADSCRAAGFAAVSMFAGRTPPVVGADAAVLDGHRNRERLAVEIEQFGEQLGPVPIVVLMNFPRVEDVRIAQAAGAAAVISKPFFNDDLSWQLGDVIGRQRVQGRREAA